MIAGQDVQRLRQEAQVSFRYVPFNKVTEDSMVSDAAPIEGGGPISGALFNQTSPAEFGEVDAFVSHSWHDPAASKFEELRRWSENFRAAMGREPRLWIDKYCIDQANIEADLRCLPIYLAGCERLLICWGPTYIERLWCVVELYVFLQMGGEIENIEILPCSMNKQSIQLAVDAFSMQISKPSRKKILIGC